MSKDVTVTSGQGAFASKVFVNGADEALKAMLIAQQYTTTKNGNLLAPTGLSVGEVGATVSSYTAALAASRVAKAAPEKEAEKEVAFTVNVKDGKSYVHGIRPDKDGHQGWHTALTKAGATVVEKTGDLKIPAGKEAIAFLEATLGKDKIKKYGGYKINDLDALMPEKADEKEVAFTVNVKDGKSYVHGVRPDKDGHQGWHTALTKAGATVVEKTGDLKIPAGKEAIAFLEATLGKDKIEKYGGYKVNVLNAPAKAEEKESSIEDYAKRADEMAQTPDGVKALTEVALNLAKMSADINKIAKGLQQ